MAPVRNRVINHNRQAAGSPVNNAAGGRNAIRPEGSATPSRSSGVKGQETFALGETTEWQGGSCQFDTTIPTETKEITWRIRGFSTLQALKAADEPRKIVFSAGETIGLPSKWSFSLLQGPAATNNGTGANNNGNGTANATAAAAEDKIGLFLALEEYNGSEEKIFARFDSVIKYPDGVKELVNRTVQPTEMRSVEDWGWSAFITGNQLKASGVLVGDVLSIELKFFLYGRNTVNVTKFDTSEVALEQESREGVIDSMTKLLESGSFSDFSIKVRAAPNSESYDVIKVHKNILAARSSVFQAMFETDMVEKENDEVTVEDISPKGLRIILAFIYTGVVDKEWMKVPEEIVYASDKYGLSILKSILDKKLHFTCTNSSAFKLLKLAKLHGLENAAKNISEFIKANVDSVMDSF